MGLRTTPFGDLHLDGHRVPVTDRLGPEGAGSSIFRNALTVERAFIYAGQLGGVERLIDDCVAYARTRRQFGRPIGDFQAVSHRIAEMTVRHETARLALYKAAVLHQAGRPTETAAAVAKLHASESAVASALDAVQIHGARGYLPAEGVERRLRDAVGGLVYSGTVDVQRNILVRLLGLG
jgi:alkylation response protein AidB-like acyl-CoA dehydrogenase